MTETADLHNSSAYNIVAPLLQQTTELSTDSGLTRLTVLYTRMYTCTISCIQDESFKGALL